MKGGMKKAFTALLAATVLVGGMPVNMQANVIAETEKAESASEKVNEKYADTEELDLMDRERQETQAGEQEKRENTEQPESEETEQPDTEEQSEETEQPDTEEQPEETEQPDTETELPEMEEETEEPEEAENTDEAEQNIETQIKEEESVKTQTEAVQSIPEVNFTESSLMQWPVEGQVLLVYNMDHTIYFPTLNEYRYSPAIAVGAGVGTPVLAVANGKVVSVVNNEETGLTMTVDLGNGYQAVYGQLKDTAFEPESYMEAGATLGYVSEPTKYYSKEGSNLYFAMTKDGVAVDPLEYLP